MPRLLPILGLPLLADGVLTLALKVRRRLTASDGIARKSVANDEG